MNDMKNTDYTAEMHPGPEPIGERSTSPNPEFVRACMSKVSSRAELVGLRLGRSALTHSDIWGFVFRIDLQSPDQGQSAEISHRFVCWSAEKDDVVMGTALIPVFKLNPL